MENKKCPCCGSFAYITVYNVEMKIEHRRCKVCDTAF
jgi:transposase-like protein